MDAEETVAAGPRAQPVVPQGRRLALPGRGTTFVRELPGPPGAPTVLLLHGLMATGGLNWLQAFEPLSRHFRVVAVDHRGHGRGIRTRRRFRLADCADDAAAVLQMLGIDEAIAVGYSMGGPIASLLWRRHPDRVAGLVLCATAPRFRTGGRERAAMVTAGSALAGALRASEVLLRIPLSPVASRIPFRVRYRPRSLAGWAAAELRRSDRRHTLEAVAALGAFDARPWLAEIDVPTTVLITTEDRAVRPDEQEALLAIPGARVRKVTANHLFASSPVFGRILTNMCLGVANRAAADAPAGRIRRLARAARRAVPRSRPATSL
jgi:pimeloyl-ACP methyl ester carboxylesterase